MLELILLGVVGLIVYLFAKGGNSSESPTQVSDALESRNADWALFIAGYYDKAKTKQEKRLIESMLNELAAKGLPVPKVGEMQAAVAPTANPVFVEEQYEPVYFEDQPVKEPVDNATILLYFGAFLFVASVGLFVAFGGLPGVLRTLAVALIAAVMYTGGIWLHGNKPKLLQAGLAFSGIGIASAPFVGLAAYSFIFDSANGRLVWFGTSLVCIALYAHALYVLQKPLLNYILIFTLLSLFMSSASVFDAPLYYIGWILATSGIVFSAIARRTDLPESFRQSSLNSADLFVPLSLLVSVVVVGSQGFLQLGVSLLIAALYYALEFSFKDGLARQGNAAASQVLFLAGLGFLVYGIDHRIAAASTVLIIANLLLMSVLFVKRSTTELWTNYGSILMASMIVSACMSITSPGLLTTALVMNIFTGACLWLLQKRDDAYIVAAAALTALPPVVGYFVFEPRLSASLVAVLLLLTLAIQWITLAGLADKLYAGWQSVALQVYIASAAVAIVFAFMASPSLLFIACLAIALSIVLLATRDELAHWTAYAGVITAIPILQTESRWWLLTATLTALFSNIVIAYQFRQEFSRWVSTALWVLLPFILNEVFTDWSEAAFAWSFFGVMLALLLSRSIARGVILASQKVSISSYEKRASSSYAIGYTAAAALAVIVSLTSPDSQTHTTVILAMLSLLTWFVASKVEKQPDLFVLLPILVQLFLVSLFRPGSTPDMHAIYIVSASVAAMGMYALACSLAGGTKRAVSERTHLVQGAVLAAFFAPLSVLYATQDTILLPISLLAATGLLYHAAKRSSQASHEWIAGLGLVAIWWGMSILGVTNIQAYTHVLAALFGAFAVWRSSRGDTSTSDAYIIAMLTTATVPLALQALGGSAGGLYGWWLLLEQVAFMLMGMALNKPLLTRWGLYVALAAVLYQLRGLGWAALSLLAVFLIGVAVYRLNKQED